jgi:hypothetical protein
MIPRVSETRLRESVLDLLGPTDDPNMLGRIGPYEIIGLVGQEGMGAVFKGLIARSIDSWRSRCAAALGCFGGKCRRMDGTNGPILPSTVAWDHRPERSVSGHANTGG